jgi:hypothetical protein
VNTATVDGVRILWVDNPKLIILVGGKRGQVLDVEDTFLLYSDPTPRWPAAWGEPFSIEARRAIFSSARSLR